MRFFSRYLRHMRGCIRFFGLRRFKISQLRLGYGLPQFPCGDGNRRAVYDIFHDIFQALQGAEINTVRHREKFLKKFFQKVLHFQNFGV